MPRPAAVGIIACGKYIPQNRLTNESLSKEWNIDGNWIEERTGIRSRHYSGPQETASFMAAAAARQALDRADLNPSEIGLVISCSYSNDNLFPPLACKVQGNLKATHAGAFDLSAGSAGFEIAVTLAKDRLTADPGIKNILVVASALQSPFLDPKNPKTSVLFGDGAAAAVISFVPKGYGLLGTETLSKPEALDAIRLRSGGLIEMDGMAVGKMYLKYQPVMIQHVLKKTGLELKDIHLFVFHQANPKLIHLLVSKLKLPPEKTFTNCEIYGNTSDASVALALCEAVEKGMIKRGNRILLAGVGPGMTFAASVLKWY